jgi:predicted Zn-dependent peptidase
VNEALREEVYTLRFPSGLRVHLLPKRGFLRKTGALAVHYGALDGAFIPPGRSDVVTAPAGLAHFLEHRVFTSKKGDAFLRFASLGASSNAATSYEDTTFYFSCVDRVPECLGILLEILDGFHITEAMVQKERGIIEEEIRGYDDNPSWVIYQRAMACLFIHSHARHDISGTLESIGEIDADLLRTTAQAFYHPGNADLFLSGDLEPGALYEWIGKSQGDREPQPPVKRVEKAEPPHPAFRTSRVSMRVSQPKVLVGFKEKTLGVQGTPLIRRKIETSLALSAAFGRASDFFQDLYAGGVIDDSFTYQPNFEPRIGFTLIGADTDHPETFLARLFERLERVRREGVSSEDFHRIHRRIRGRFLQNFNHPDSAAFALLSHTLRGAELLDVPALLDTVTLDAVNRRLAEHLDPAAHVRSIVEPVRKG